MAFFSISIWYLVTSSLTRVTHVVKPMECNLVSSSYDFFTIVLAGIWCRRLLKFNTDMVHCTLGGNMPHSPCTMMLLVVALTFSMRLQYLNMTLLIDYKPALRCPQTSLPYTNMGFITESNNLNITFGGSGAMSRIFMIYEISSWSSLYLQMFGRLPRCEVFDKCNLSWIVSV